MRPIAENFMKKYPFVKMTFWRADTEEIVAEAVGRSARQQCRRRSSSKAPASANSRSRPGSRSPITRPWSRPIRERYRDPRSTLDAARGSAITASPTTRRLVPRRPGAEDLRRPARSAMEGQAGLAHRDRRAARRCSLPTSGSPGRGEGARRIPTSSRTQKIVNFGSGSARTLVDRVIAGEYPIALNIFAHHPLISKAKGAPVNSQLLDPVAVDGRDHERVRACEHPYAALLLVDFILSKEGQEIFARPIISRSPGRRAARMCSPRRAEASPAYRSFRELGQAQPVYRKLAEDFRRDVPVIRKRAACDDSLEEPRRRSAAWLALRWPASRDLAACRGARSSCCSDRSAGPLPLQRQPARDAARRLVRRVYAALLQQLFSGRFFLPSLATL